MDVNFSKLWDIGKDRGDWRAAVCEVAKSWKRLSEWTCMRAKLLPSSLSLCNPMDCNPPGFSVYGDSPDKNTGVSCHALLGGIFPTQRLNPRLLCLLHWQHITLFNFLHSFLLSCEVMFAFIFSSSSFFFFSPITYKPPDNRDLSWSINSSDTRCSSNPRYLYHTGEGDANQQPLKLDWCHVFK